MALLRKYWYAVVFFVFLIVALVANEGNIPAGSDFYSWLFVGVWCTFTLYFGDNLKRSSEFNSPHNTFTYISAPLFVGLIFCFWGYFTSILPNNLFDGSSVWMSGWDLIFSFPYLLIGSVLLWKCFRKYDWVYVGSSSFKARRFGFLSVVFFLAIEIIFISVIYNTPSNIPPLPRMHDDIDLLLLISIFSLIIILVYYSVFRRKPSIPRVAQRRTVAPAQRVPATSARTGSQVYSRSSTGQNPNVRVVLPHGSKHQPFRGTSREPAVRYHLEQPRQAAKKQTQAQPKPRIRAVQYDKLLPKAGQRSAEDFKCIFCFQLPKAPEDANRGVVLCPYCRYPAHADEFRNWMKNSNLCSRCGHIISSGFRQRPEVISAAEYAEVIKEFYRRGGK